MITSLDIATIRTDGGTQPRAVLDLEAAESYAEALRSGATFPPVVVFYDGTDHWLAHGFHRHAAHKLADLPTIEADVRQGTRRDAILHACGANEENGMRRTDAERRRAVRTLLEDEEWTHWPYSKIAEVSRTSLRFVKKVADQLELVHRALDGTRVVSKRDGTVYTIDTSKIGKSTPAPKPARDIIAKAVAEHRAADRDEDMGTGDARRAVERLLADFTHLEALEPKSVSTSLPDAFVSDEILEQVERLISWLSDLADGLSDRLNRGDATDVA